VLLGARRADKLESMAEDSRPAAAALSRSSAATVRRPRAGVSLLALLRALRPLQWTKNLLLFAGIVFSATFDELSRWEDALAIFVAYCAASSAAYLLNDVQDAELDRRHPLKRFRPIAAREVSPRTALAAAVALALVALGVSLAVNFGSGALLAGFLLLQLAYSTVLKRRLFVGVLAIAGLFVIRAAAGAIAVDVRLSPWLVACTGLVALFLALAKRRGELASGDSEALRPALRGYTVSLLDQLVALAAGATISTYTLYTVVTDVPDALIGTVPLVAFGLLRYLYLVHRRDVAEEPDRVLVTDRPILITVAAWVIMVIVVLSGSPPR
jgi:4-hydroxybenzoate polyprenyltransferase